MAWQREVGHVGVRGVAMLHSQGGRAGLYLEEVGSGQVRGGHHMYSYICTHDHGKESSCFPQKGLEKERKTKAL